jgi:predicted amidohydrolase
VGLGLLQEKSYIVNMNCTIGLVQFSVDADQDMAILRAEQKIRDAAENGAQIICLPELFSTPYFPQHIGIESACYAQPRDGPFLRRFLHLASNLKE